MATFENIPSSATPAKNATGQDNARPRAIVRQISDSPQAIRIESVPDPSHDNHGLKGLEHFEDAFDRLTESGEIDEESSEQQQQRVQQEGENSQKLEESYGDKAAKWAHQVLDSTAAALSSIKHAFTPKESSQSLKNKEDYLQE